jgi:hypothetical protein
MPTDNYMGGFSLHWKSAPLGRTVKLYESLRPFIAESAERGFGESRRFSYSIQNIANTCLMWMAPARAAGGALSRRDVFSASLLTAIFTSDSDRRQCFDQFLTRTRKGRDSGKVNQRRHEPEPHMLFQIGVSSWSKLAEAANAGILSAVLSARAPSLMCFPQFSAISPSLRNAQNATKTRKIITHGT